jgi:hypothetical protein
MDGNRRGAQAIERRTVSRKTPGDGKLEITKVAAERLEPLGAEFSLVVDDVAGGGTLASMPCTCRGGDKPHVHHFVESELLRSLAAGSEVDLFLEVLDDGVRRLLVVTT